MRAALYFPAQLVVKNVQPQMFVRRVMRPTASATRRNATLRNATQPRHGPLGVNPGGLWSLPALAQNAIAIAKRRHA